MNSARFSIPWVMLAVFAVALMLGLYFTFAAVQGDYGLFRRAEILSDAKKLISLAKKYNFDSVKFQKRDLNICIPEHQKNIKREKKERL